MACAPLQMFKLVVKLYHSSHAVIGGASSDIAAANGIGSNHWYIDTLEFLTTPKHTKIFLKNWFQQFLCCETLVEGS